MKNLQEINALLANDPEVTGFLPLKPTDDNKKIVGSIHGIPLEMTFGEFHYVMAASGKDEELLEILIINLLKSKIKHILGNLDIVDTL